MAPGPPSLMEQTCTNLKLTLTKSGGIPSEQLSCDYRNMTGEGIPFRKLGFDSLGALLESLKDTLIVRKLPTGGMMVALAGAAQHQRQSSNIRDLRNSRNLSNPKKPIRRPKQQSINWTPPKKHNDRSKENLNSRSKENLHIKSKENSSPKYRENSFIKSKESFSNRYTEIQYTNQQRNGGNNNSHINNNYHNNKSESKKPPLRQPKMSKGSQSESVEKLKQKNPRTFSSKALLDEFFKKKNLGSLSFKIATMGNKGKERYLATITVDNVQYKTYPQTYSSKEEAEEAVSDLAIKKLGVTDLNIEPTLRITKDLFIYAKRVTEILAERANGVWSHQIESEYSEKFNEKLPQNWFEKLEDINQIKVDSPVPNSVRVIVFPTGLDFLTSLPPNLSIPEDNIWEVFVTVVRSTTNVNCRFIGSTYTEMYDNLISDMDLHYFDKTKTPGVTDINVGKVYAAQVSSDWHRVKVVSTMNGSSNCYFLDHGDTDTILNEDLRELDQKFLVIPPQVFTVEVSGLQDFGESDTLLNQLNQNLLGKPLAAMVENRTVFQKKLECDGIELPKLIFFDTSTEDVDININQKLIEFIVKENSHSKLPKPGGEEIKVTVPAIMSNGDLCVRKLQDTSSSSMVEEGHLTVLTSSNSTDNMTIKCRLEGAPPKGHKWSQAATEAFRELVGEDDVVHLRVIREESDYPFVELNLPDSNDGSINFDLSTEFDIFPLDSCEVIKQEVNNNDCSEKLSLESTPEVSLNDIISLKTLLPASLPCVGDHIQLTICYAVSPDNFVIRTLSDQGDELSELLTSMNEFYNKSENNTKTQLTSLNLSADQYAAAKLDNDQWHRVEVIQVIPNEVSSFAVVRYVDQGSQAMLDGNQLHHLTSKFRNTPCQAVAAALTGVSPLNGDWTPEDNYWFNSRVAGKQFQGKVLDSKESKIVIELLDAETNETIQEQLVKAKRGIYN